MCIVSEKESMVCECSKIRKKYNFGKTQFASKAKVKIFWIKIPNGTSAQRIFFPRQTEDSFSIAIFSNCRALCVCVELRDT